MLQSSERCPNYQRLGYCQEESACSLLHMAPSRSRCLLFPNIYSYSTFEVASLEGIAIPKLETERAIEDFGLLYECLFFEMLRHGKIADLLVCDNLYAPLRGSLYVLFDREKSAAKCRKEMAARAFNGKLLQPQFVDLETLDEAVCPSSKLHSCPKAGRCVSVHRKFVSQQVKNMCLDRSEKLAQAQKSNLVN